MFKRSFNYARESSSFLLLTCTAIKRCASIFTKHSRTFAAQVNEKLKDLLQYNVERRSFYFNYYKQELSLSLSLTHHKIEEHERLIWRNCFNSGETKGNASLAATHQENYVEIIHDFLFSFKVFARAERSACSYAGVTDTVRCEACTYAHTRRESVSSQRRRARFTAACLH